MIVSRLAGGMGNQMFQYAIARSLSAKGCGSLYLDTGFLDNSEATNDFTKRSYELGCYNLKPKLVSYLSPDILIDEYARKRIFKRFFTYKKENSLLFDESVLEKCGNLYLEGHWASEKYFSDARSVLVRDFVLKKASRIYGGYLGKITNTNSVSVHVRRGDYISNPSANKTHGLADKSFYRDAMKKIESTVRDPHYFVFSDDISWCRENIKSDNIIYISGTSAGEDINLMSRCKHNIIANSTFSWWGAWLNGNADKKVIAPKKWFLDVNLDSTDLVPRDWIRI